ncbi:hypothetical protein DFP72DRAFT_590332 [Ephemerocybe angulata]|uniref:Uncharacterized protein n=1 Tax=Ephemerocybe angulata TaxID=980116 RepID=A0A8H6HK63_9AGAR|nr:hypothetical protein DFP72DRAFT_590332 [Tulosesus angulatus]
MSIDLRHSAWRQLPEEVIISISYHVNRLPFHRISTLKSCSLTSRAFLRPSQAHIFASINFDISRTSRFVVFQSLCRTLLKNRGLGLHVRELQLRSDTPDLYELHIPALNSFRTMLGLNKFTFICGRRSGDGTSDPEDAEMLIGWEQFARTVRGNLNFVFSLPTLRTLELGGIHNLPSTLLVSFMKMEHLLLDSHLSIDSSMNATSPTGLMVLSSIRLQSLTLREVDSGVVNALASMLAYKPNGLKRLDLAPVRLAGVEGFSGAVWNLLRLGGRGLQAFEWEGVSARPHAFKPIDLSTIRTSLRHLSVSITYSVWFAEPQVLIDLHALLRQLSSADVALEVVTIKTAFAGASSGDGSSNLTDFAGFDLTSDPEFLDEWSDLDKILSHKKAFKKLDRIELEYVRHTASSKATATSSLAVPVRGNSKSFPPNKGFGTPPSLAEVAYTKELEWWTDTACTFAERLAGTRARGVVIVFGESKTRRRSWAVFEPRSPEVVGGQDSFEWRPMRVGY